MKQVWRWFGPDDVVTLNDARQAGATGIVSALHHIPAGDVWEKGEISKRKQLIEDAGLVWSVAESIPVHENIKIQTGNYQQLIENYKSSIKNLSRCGIFTVCYNYMPLLDATRTDFKYFLSDGSSALLFNTTAFAAFELFILKRKGAEEIYDPARQKEAHSYLAGLTYHQKDALIGTIVAGFPGVGSSYTLSEFQEHLNVYKDITAASLKENLRFFLREIIPVAEEAGVRMAIHPDDPPFSVLGLPRIVSTEADLSDIVSAVDSLYNGLCICTGSLGVLEENELPGIIKRYGSKINFVHLRNIKRLGNGSFYESDHLSGDVDMFSVVEAIHFEEQKRISEGRADAIIPMRPDHGHQMLDDLNKNAVPGYSGIGRLRGLAELRGLELAIKRSFHQNTINF